MKHRTHAREWRAGLVGLALVLVPTAWALPPAPANDEPANAEVIPTVPALIYGTTVLANNSISTTVLPPPADDVDGPDVFYSFTPANTATYRVQLWPWQEAPLRSSDRRFTIYALNASLTAIAGARAPGDARPVSFDVSLTAGQTYLLGVDYNAATYDNFPFTLAVDELDLNNPDNCGSVEALGSTLPVLRMNSINGAVHDFSFTQGTGRCGVSGSTPTTAPGNDHVYKFTAPADGDYAIELVSDGFDGVLYVNTSCPPVFPGGCLGASNHSTGGTSGGRHELVVVTLTANMDYYIYVDNGSTTAITGAYALVIDDAFNYEINEIEPNDSVATASPLGTPLNGGQLVGPADTDFWAVPGLTGDRVYAWVNNGGTSNSTLDADLAFWAADGTTLIEFDDEDADGADAPINDWRFVYSTSSPVIAGAQLTSNGTHYFQVTDQSATGTIHRYRFHVGVLPGERSPAAECEPNGDLASADFSGKNYFAGVIDTATDKDVYAFEAQVGDRIFVAFDGDPERDANGVDPANTDPNAFHGKLVIYDPFGDILISDISDANNVTNAPDYPAQGGFFIARTAGTHYVEVGPQSSSSQVGPTETYELALFINDAAPALAEDDDPLLTLTPDYAANTIAGVAADAGSDVCVVELVAATNLQITNLSSLPGATATFDLELVSGATNGQGKLVVTDCAGNTTCQLVNIDVTAPVCTGFNYSVRQMHYHGDPVWVPDNDPTGVAIPLEITEPGLVTDVNVTVTFETTSVSDLDVFLRSPTGTVVELFTDRGSSSAFNLIDATLDDAGTELIPLLSGDEPYTGVWKPEGSLATFNGLQAQGTWELLVADDSSSEGGGLRLTHWMLEITATFPAPQSFAGTATDAAGFDAGVLAIELSDADNVELLLPPDFTPGDTTVLYTVALLDPSQAGSGTITVTDMQENTCQSVVALAGLADTNGPLNTGEYTTDLRLEQEVQVAIPSADPAGVVATLPVFDDFLVGEVEVDLTIDTRDLGRLAATLTKGANFTALVNRVGMDERQSVGLTKNTIDITLDDDAPVADDAHLEPALGTIPFRGPHQPDGRGEFIGDGIDTDKRDNMLFTLAGVNALGGWKLQAADYRLQGTTRSELRRWAITLKSHCAGERFVGRATDLTPGTGIASLALAPGATNLQVLADFTPGAEVVDYRVELVDRAQPGSGTLVITDGASNETLVPIGLAEAGADQHLPVISGSVDLGTDQFEGTATDNQAGDSGIVDVTLAPYADNLQLVSVTPNPPNNAASVDFVIGLVNPAANGRGYVRVTDGCGWRSFLLVEIDAVTPVCTGGIDTTKRYVSTDLPQPIPDNNTAGVVSSIVVSDSDVVADVDLTLNIMHNFDDDIDATLIAPLNIPLFSDIGNLGNDFTDTVLDDEAPAPIPDVESEAPFTGRYQPEAGPSLLLLDGVPAAATYSVRIADDKTNDFGVFLSWALTLTSPTFPKRYDGRVEDSEGLATGVCSIELLSGGANLTLVVDPFVPGEKIVRYSVELTNPDLSGKGTVRVTDCGGNTCTIPVEMLGLLALGDMDCDGDVDFGDINPFVLALSNPAAYQAMFPTCDIMHGDINNNGNFGFDDINPFVALLSQ